MSVLTASKLLDSYYKETDPLKRRAILMESLEKEEDPVANPIRLELWNARYAKKLDKSGDARADGFIRLWVMLKYFSGGHMNNFTRKRHQKEVQKLLDSLGYTAALKKGPAGEEVLLQECRHAASVYMNACLHDKRYGTALMGLVSISEEKIQEKIAADTVTAAKTVPESLQMTEEMQIFSTGSIQTYQDMFPDDKDFPGRLL